MEQPIADRASVVTVHMSVRESLLVRDKIRLLFP
jgi:hypothetical protein